MEIKKILNILKEKNLIFMRLFYYMDNEYIQALEKNTMKIIYFQIENGNLIEELDERYINDFKTFYEKKSDIVY